MNKLCSKKLMLALLLLSVMLISSCGMIQAPVVPPFGFLYTNFTSPLELNSCGGKDLGTKKGESSATAWFGFVAYGNAGIDAAVKNGGLKQVKHFDYKYKNYLFGAYAKFTVVVYGD